MADRDGYWGQITSSTEWCEKNYEHAPYIAEFFNTISNIPCIVLSVLGLINSISQRFEKRFSVLHVSTIALCIGSMLFHATLQHAQQQSDETPMVWVMLLYIYVLYSPDWHYRSTMPTFLCIYGTVFAILHSRLRFVLGFELHYIFLALLCLPRMYKYYIHSKAETVHAFAGNPIVVGKKTPREAAELLDKLVSGASTSLSLQILPYQRGKPLVAVAADSWRLAWQSQEVIGKLMDKQLVYLGQETNLVFCAVDMGLASGVPSNFVAGDAEKLAFLDVRTLMIMSNEEAMGELSIAGHARGLLEWHNQHIFCGRCGSSTVPCEAGERRRCTRETCNNKLYPRIDPVVIMLVIDKERERILLGHQPKYVPRMWSCLAGFMEAGESLEEAVRRETKEETGIEVAEVFYHSSQPWPVGKSNMPSVMAGFFAVAKTFDIQVDKIELEDAGWFSRDQIQKSLKGLDFGKAQRAAAEKAYRALCSGEQIDRSMHIETTAEDGILFPGPYAIAHHLIATWAREGSAALLSSKM